MTLLAPWIWFGGLGVLFVALLGMGIRRWRRAHRPLNTLTAILASHRTLQHRSDAHQAHQAPQTQLQHKHFSRQQKLAWTYTEPCALADEQLSSAYHRWRWLNRGALAALILATVLAMLITARPAAVDAQAQHGSDRDIILCLDVSGSSLPYDRQIIATYLALTRHFQGERIGLSIFNSTSRTVFPLTDDYELVQQQLRYANSILEHVQDQKSIDQMNQQDYQRIADWLEGTQNRSDATSLIGDGLISCAAMVPSFAQRATGHASHENANANNDENTDTNGEPVNNDALQADTRTSPAESNGQRSASIVLATDNIMSGNATYTLNQALQLVHQAGIGVDGLYSGAPSTWQTPPAQAMKRAIEQYQGVMAHEASSSSESADTANTSNNALNNAADNGSNTANSADNASVEALVRNIERTRSNQRHRDNATAVSDTPSWAIGALVLIFLVWIALAERLRR